MLLRAKLCVPLYSRTLFVYALFEVKMMSYDSGLKLFLWCGRSETRLALISQEGGRNTLMTDGLAQGGQLVASGCPEALRGPLPARCARPSVSAGRKDGEPKERRGRRWQACKGRS